MNPNKPLLAISICQPYASAMASGAKRNETRGRPTDYRGDVVICSTTQRPSRYDFSNEAAFEAALKLPYGAAVCIVELYNCVPAEHFDKNFKPRPLLLSKKERRLGNYSPGNWIWMTRNRLKLKHPVLVAYRLAPWMLHPDIASQILAEL